MLWKNKMRFSMETSSSPSCGFSHNPLHKNPTLLDDVTELLWLRLPPSTPQSMHLLFRSGFKTEMLQDQISFSLFLM